MLLSKEGFKKNIKDKNSIEDKRNLKEKNRKKNISEEKKEKSKEFYSFSNKSNLCSIIIYTEFFNFFKVAVIFYIKLELSFYIKSS